MGIYILEVKHTYLTIRRYAKQIYEHIMTKSVIEVPLLVLVFLAGPRETAATTTHVLPFPVAPHPLLVLVRHHVTAWKDF